MQSQCMRQGCDSLSASGPLTCCFEVVCSPMPVALSAPLARLNELSVCAYGSQKVCARARVCVFLHTRVDMRKHTYCMVEYITDGFYCINKRPRIPVVVSVSPYIHHSTYPPSSAHPPFDPHPPSPHPPFDPHPTLSSNASESVSALSNTSKHSAASRNRAWSMRLVSDKEIIRFCFDHFCLFLLSCSWVNYLAIFEHPPHSHPSPPRLYGPNPP